MSAITRNARGRPRSTTHEQVAHVALERFVKDGFDETTLDAIAADVGIGRRTLFRYFASKNDMVWGDFDWVLTRLRALLDAAPAEQPMMAALRDAVVESNSYDAAVEAELRIRMTLITTVPTLQAHSMLRYEAWRNVVAEFGAQRLGLAADDLLPTALGHAALGASMAAFRRWVEHPQDSLADCLTRAYDALATGFDPQRRVGG